MPNHDRGPRSSRFGDFDDKIQTSPDDVETLKNLNKNSKLQFSSATEALGLEKAKADFIGGPSGLKDLRPSDDITRTSLDKERGNKK